MLFRSVVFSPIAQGVLTGKYLPGQPAPAGSRATSDEGAGMVSRWLRDDVLHAVQRLRPVADQAGLTMAQLAVAWTLQNDNVSSAIVGASRPEQVTEAVAAVGVRLDSDTMAAIDAALADVIERNPALTVSPEERP